MASVTLEKRDRSSEFPNWFKPEAGFRFRDSDGDPCMVIGWGGWREAKNETCITQFGQLSGTKLEFKPCGLLYMYLYKGEWHMGEIEVDVVSSGTLGWTEEQESQVSGWS